jgi:hypothetical protein
MLFKNPVGKVNCRWWGRLIVAIQVIPKRGKLWHLQTNKFSLDTICGELHLIVYDGWIACRFQDVDLAKQNLPIALQSILNPFSGKWNHHYLDGWTPKDAAQSFQDAISRILPKACPSEIGMAIVGEPRMDDDEMGGAAWSSFIGKTTATILQSTRKRMPTTGQTSAGIISSAGPVRLLI